MAFGHPSSGRVARLAALALGLLTIVFTYALIPSTDSAFAQQVTVAWNPDTGPDSRVERGFWQYNVETKPDVVKLVIRDKAGEVGTYKALFTVTAPDKKQYSSERNGSGALESVVFFPNDFGAAWTKGVYTWTCTIRWKKDSSRDV